MLKQLIINNFTLIDTLDIEFRPGFSVITGETGAGKSIILGAIGLLLGQRADSKMIKVGANRCVIEAHFDLSKYDLKPFFTDNDIDYDSEDCIIRRELLISGKSRSFINDTPVQLSMLKELGDQLVDIHSQHQNLLLNKENFQLSVLDIVANNAKFLEDYKISFYKYKELCQKLERLKAEALKAKDDEEYIRFQLKEIDEKKFQPNEQQELEQESEVLSHAEEIKECLFNVSSSLDGEENGIVNTLKSQLNALRSLTKVYSSSEELADRIESSYIELKDIASEIDNRLEKIDFNPSRLDEVNDRLNIIYSLQQKHHVETIDKLLNIANEYKEQINRIDGNDEELNELEKGCDEIRAELSEKAALLTKKRIQASKEIERQMIERLIPLGMPNIRFQVIMDSKEFSMDGCDKVSFYFSANTSTPLQPVAQIASGGEIARVMLSLKAMISGTVKLPTIIFDEIDTGVSGSIAEKMAQIMHEMGENNRQVISITHLPQIAALGSTHYKVYKEETERGTTSRMVLLSKEERIKEIAQMLSGSKLTDAAINNAKELLK